jgi:sulfur carrier protein
VRVVINGQNKDVSQGNFLDMLKSLSIEPASVVMEINEEVAQRPTWGQRQVAEGDHIEILKFVGGG